MEQKTVEQTKVIYGNLMEPQHANINGTVHGGEILRIMDCAGGVVAKRHARSKVSTARVDCLDFNLPIYVGNYIYCVCEMNFVGTTSMEVMIKVMAEDLKCEGEPKVALTGYFTYVALDDEGKPAPVPQLKLVTDEEVKRFNEGRERYLENKRKRAEGRA